MGKQKKQMVVVGFLLVILVVAWTVALKPKSGKTVVVNTGLTESMTGAPVQNTAIAKSGSAPSADRLNMQDVEEKLAKIKSATEKIEEVSGHQEVVAITHDPFEPPAPASVPGHKIAPAGFVPSDLPPNFAISGVAYDKEKPFAVIDDEVKGENEYKDGFLVYRILPDRVLFKKKDKLYVIKVNALPSSDVSTSGISLSDSSDTSPESAVLVSNGGYRFRSILKEPAKPVAEIEMKFQTETALPRQISVVAPQCSDENKVLYQPGHLELKPGHGKIVTVQVGSFGSGAKKYAIEIAKQLESKGYKDVRVEKISGMYTVRVGMFDSVAECGQLCEQLKEFSPDSFVRSAYYIKERIVYVGDWNQQEKLTSASSG